MFFPFRQGEHHRLVLALGDKSQRPRRPKSDSLELLRNKISVNMLAHHLGCSSVGALDRHVWSLLCQSARAYREREITQYFTRLAAGKPLLCRTEKRGRPISTLQVRLSTLGDSANEFEVAKEWVFYNFINLAAKKLLDSDEIGLPMGGSNVLCDQLTAIRSPKAQARSLRDEISGGDMCAALTALWASLRASILSRDLGRYLILYATWLEARGVIENSPVFGTAAELLYSHTACWFGQLHMHYDPDRYSRFAGLQEFTRSIESRSVKRVGQADPPADARDSFDPLLLVSDALHEGLMIRLIAK